MRRVLDLMIGFIHLIHSQIGTAGNTALSVIYTLYSSPFYTHTHTHTHKTHNTLGFSAFSSRILATDLSQSQCNFKSHMKSSFHSLSPFLSLFCNCHLRGLDSIQFFCSQAHIPASLRPETRLCSHLLMLVHRSRIFLPWRFRWYVTPKRRLTQDLHNATS
jgi:hypothetical protein